ncbi:MAG: electron transfer flavoprotein subunit beta/FixA family protein [Elusimicrobia bacterium]|nr:electron transfer flavoprotein subunit beta/FixA family protein [Elusimicrobiota bacterium]
MAIKIAVCVKRTPASTSVAIDASGQVQTKGLPHGINPFDEYAVEEALRLKEKLGGTVTAVSAGAPEAEEVVRAAIALGCDDGVLLADPAFQGSDGAVTARILAAAIRKAGAQLVLFGKETNDGASGCMTAFTAANLDCPSVINVRKVVSASESELTVERLMEDGVDTLTLKLPAVVGVTKEINEPRLPSLKGKMNAKKAPVAKWTPADLGLDPSALGAAASQTHVVSMEPVPARAAGVIIEGATPEEKAKALVEKLKEAKFI